jgi:hypothetical protein
VYLVFLFLVLLYLQYLQKKLFQLRYIEIRLRRPNLLLYLVLVDLEEVLLEVDFQFRLFQANFQEGIPL